VFRCKTKTWITCGCLAVLFILLLSSCTNESTSSVSPTATVGPLSQEVFRDGFDSQDGNWTTYSSTDGSAFYENGKLHIKNYTASEYPSGSYIQQQFSDFALEVEMELVSGSTATWQSVVCRYNGMGDSYMFCINANGKYSILKSVGGVATMLRTPSPSSHIRTGLGVTNNIRVECIGNSLTLYVNGFSVTQVSDNTLVTGYVGFSVESTSGEYSEAAFDNVVIWTS
jgi:3-keto-disaccharide hydrolase